MGIFFGFLIFSILVISNNAKLPSDIKPCKAGDSKCIIETINWIIETKYKGDPELNLISIDPLQVDNMVLKQPKTSPVNIELILRDNIVSGYKNFRAYKVRGFAANPEGKHEIYLNGPYASMVGSYSIDGKILILPIRGEGRSNLTLDNVFIKINIHAGSKIKDGLTFMDVKDVRLNLNTSRLHLNFENLFNGDKNLGDSLNKFMNENWQDIFGELKQGVLDAFGVVYTNFLRKLFATHPYSELIEGGN